MKYVVKFLDHPKKIYIVEANSGDEATELACKEAGLIYNPKKIPSNAFMRIDSEEDLKYFII